MIDTYIICFKITEEIGSYYMYCFDISLYSVRRDASQSVRVGCISLNNLTLYATSLRHHAPGNR